MPEWENYFEAEVEIVECLCEECMRGYMRFKSTTISTALLEVTDKVFSHSCSYCGKEKKLPKKFPRIEFKRKDTGEYIECH